jgi:hypothetical protein
MVGEVQTATAGLSQRERDHILGGTALSLYPAIA